MSGVSWCTLPAWFHSARAGLNCNFRVRIAQPILQCTECSGHQIINCQDAEEYSASFCRMRMEHAGCMIMFTKTCQQTAQWSISTPSDRKQASEVRFVLLYPWSNISFGRNIRLVCVLVQDMSVFALTNAFTLGDFPSSRSVAVEFHTRLKTNLDRIEFHLIKKSCNLIATWSSTRIW